MDSSCLHLPPSVCFTPLFISHYRTFPCTCVTRVAPVISHYVFFFLLFFYNFLPRLLNFFSLSWTFFHSSSFSFVLFFISNFCHSCLHLRYFLSHPHISCFPSLHPFLNMYFHSLLSLPWSFVSPSVLPFSVSPSCIYFTFPNLLLSSDLLPANLILPPSPSSSSPNFHIFSFLPPYLPLPSLVSM